MRFIFYGNEVKWPVYLKTKQTKNYSNGSAMQVEILTSKQFERESKRYAKILEKRSKK